MPNDAEKLHPMTTSELRRLGFGAYGNTVEYLMEECTRLKYLLARAQRGYDQDANIEVLEHNVSVCNEDIERFHEIMARDVDWRVERQLREYEESMFELVE